ncbi:phosphatidylethanolamine-binding protein [Ampelomyces quisqualis]|uniref:Phosphatidylethanolamine-binding protein n=1 Tax=Ampelomyces quisqualis TaxID=50730 RepID=A0A6A5QTB1_AMPQU|nr:phosphatidylethanolamine-binding protein [Ampelomyces quisqualis]
MYISSSSLVVAALASCAIGQAQTPQGFTPSVNTKLEVFFNSNSVKTPGELLSKATTTTEPQLAISSAAGNLSDTYVFVMLDLDVPPQQGSTERRVLLHAMNTGFKATQQTLSGAGTLLASNSKGPAAYLPPGPPANDTVAHRYVQLLFREPATLEVQAADFANINGRFNFDIQSFMQNNNLGEPVAGNFFMVDGRVNATTGSGRGSPTGTGGMPSSTLATFEGTAGRWEVSCRLVGALCTLAMLVV